MKFVMALGFALVSSLSLNALAKDRPTVVPKPESTVVEDSSAHHRLDKKYMATAILVGIGPSVSSTAGLQGAYYLDHDSQILVEVTGGSLRSSSDLASSTSGSKYDVSTKSLGVHYKAFTGNSFYYRAGGDFRTTDYKYTFTYSGGSVDSAEFKGRSLVANFQIGNQWQWENFTLGCDWVGYVLPLTSEVSDDKVNSSTPDVERRRLNDDADTLVKNGHLTLLRFYLGASF